MSMPCPLVGADDFSYVLRKVPGAMVLLGATPKGGDFESCCPIHSNRNNWLNLLNSGTGRGKSCRGPRGWPPKSLGWWAAIPILRWRPSVATSFWSGGGGLALQGVVWAKKAFADQRRARPDDKISFLTVLHSDCDLSTPSEVRKEVADLLLTYRDHLASAAIAFEGDGFRMTVVRSIITAINLATHMRFPNAVFGNTAEAVSWLHQRSTKADSSIRVHQLIVTLDRIRRL